MEKNINRNTVRHSAGFTIIELLVVVAIIGILVAISIPVFAGQLEKAREATDIANIRSAYAKVMVRAASDEETKAETIALNQKVDHWQSSVDFPATVIGEPAANGSAKVYFNEADNKAVIEFTLSTGNISYATQGLYDDTFYIANKDVTSSNTWKDIDKNKVKKIVFQSGSSLSGGDASNFFAGFTNLEEIDMSNVDLRKTSYDTFKNTPKLKKITLANLPADDKGYDFPGTWYYDEACTSKLGKGKMNGDYSRITPNDNGKTLYRNVN